MSAIIVSPHFLATKAGDEILKTGGNAIDAAIAVNAVQGVVAPETCGIGGDLFALIWMDGEEKPYCLDSSGYAGSNVLNADLSNLASIPLNHAATITVPGAVKGWETMYEKFGSLQFDSLLKEAINLCQEGFPVSKELSQSITLHQSSLEKQSSGRNFYAKGKPLEEGKILKRTQLGETLSHIGEKGSSFFYSGDLAQKIIDSTDNLLTLNDLASYQSIWVEPLSLNVYGKAGWTTPPHTQGYLTLATLKAYELSAKFDDLIDHHMLIECYRALAADRDNITYDYCGEISKFKGLDLDYIQEKTASITHNCTSIFPPPGKHGGGTAYMAIKDSMGNAVSLIQSNFHGIGSTIEVGSYGFFLHNRGAGFNLKDSHPNKISPLRKPLHTLSPTIWSDNGNLDMVVGTRGGRNQPQLLSQFILPHLLKNSAYEENMAKGRWTINHFGEGTASELIIEPSFGEKAIEELREKGHSVKVTDSLQASFGPISAIFRKDNESWVGLSDPRVETAEVSQR